MHKQILVKTDASNKKRSVLMVQGRVDKKAKVEPETLFLNGKPGDTIEAAVTITPSQKNMLSILGVEQKPDSGLKTKLVKPETKDDPWQLLVTAVSEKTAHIYETVILKTDNDREPVIKIMVSVNFSKGI